MDHRDDASYSEAPGHHSNRSNLPQANATYQPGCQPSASELNTNNTMRKPRSSCGLGIAVLTVLLHRRLDYASFASADALADALSLLSMPFALGCHRKRIRQSNQGNRK